VPSAEHLAQGIAILERAIPDREDGGFVGPQPIADMAYLADGLRRAA
jgi:hypothetical protein